MPVLLKSLKCDHDLPSPFLKDFKRHPTPPCPTPVPKRCFGSTLGWRHHVKTQRLPVKEKMNLWFLAGLWNLAKTL